MAREKLRLLDLDDVYGFATTVVRRKLPGLNATAEEDAIQAVVFALWRRAQRFDPSRGSFYKYASRYATGDLVDHVRRELGRTRWSFGDGGVHERERPDIVSLDGLVDEAGGLDAVVAARALDPEMDWSPALERALAA